MSRLLTAAAYAMHTMPIGTTFDAPVLSDEDAYDVAAYIISQKRPQKANLDRDFPIRLQKPIDTPYGPYADVSAWSNTGSVRSVRSAPRLGNLPRSPGPRAQADRTTDRMNLDVRDRRRRSLDCRFRGIWGNFAGVCPGKREG